MYSHSGLLHLITTSNHHGVSDLQDLFPEELHVPTDLAKLRDGVEPHSAAGAHPTLHTVCFATDISFWFHGSFRVQVATLLYSRPAAPSSHLSSYSVIT